MSIDPYGGTLVDRVSTGAEADELRRYPWGGNAPTGEVANLDQLPEWGAYLVALPMKIRGGSGGPLRIVALMPSADR